MMIECDTPGYPCPAVRSIAEEQSWGRKPWYAGQPSGPGETAPKLPAAAAAAAAVDGRTAAAAAPPPAEVMECAAAAASVAAEAAAVLAS